MPAPRSSSKATVMLAVSAAVYTVLRLVSIWTPRLWGDEVFNYIASEGSLIDLFKQIGADMAHPPLFYLLLKPWVYLAGSSMAELRFLTIAFSLLAVVPMIALGRELLFRTREIALALFLMAVSNYLILYSYFLRPYSVLLFLTLCSIVAFMRLLRRDESDSQRALILVVVVNVLFVYTHYVAWLTVAAQWLWVAFMARRHLRGFTSAILVVTLWFLPWVLGILYVSTRVHYTLWSQISWSWRPGLNSVVELLRCFNGGYPSAALTLAGSAALLIIVLVPLKYGIREMPSGERPDAARLRPFALLAWLTLFPIIVSLAASYAFTWIWEPRYVIVSVGPYMLLVAASAWRLRSRWARGVAVTVVITWSAVAGLASAAGLSGDLADVLYAHGPNAPPYWLALDLSRVESGRNGPIRVYGLSANAAQGLRLATSITREGRFQIIPTRGDAPLPGDYFWIAFTEWDPIAAARVRELASNPGYALSAPIYAGSAPQRYIAIRVRRKS